MVKKVEEHSFSVQMNSEHSVKRMSFQDVETGSVFFEGVLGKLIGVTLIEGLMLEIAGVNGVLRVDISQEELKRCLEPKKNPRQGEPQ